MTTNSNLASRLKAGRQLERAKHREGDAAKLGTLRAGNSGMMSNSGDIAGSCHRRAHLRSLGLEVEEPDDSKLVMFQMGTANEDVVYRDLIHTSGPDEVILREEEIPTTWMTSNGTKVTGRPDMVVCRRDEGATVPIWGIEIKSIASVWTTRDIIGTQQPKLEHLIQAGHYSWQIGVPFRLLYKQYGIQEIPFWKGQNGPGWGQKLFPVQGAPGSEFIDYEKGRVQPFEITYELSWANGTLRYRREYPSQSGEAAGSEQWKRTLVDVESIRRYYEFTSRMAQDQELGPRPMTIDAVGKEKSWTGCSYCPLQGTCDNYEDNGYSEWLEAVRHHLANGSITGAAPDAHQQKAIRRTKGKKK